MPTLRCRILERRFPSVCEGVGDAFLNSVQGFLFLASGRGLACRWNENLVPAQVLARVSFQQL